LTEQLHPMETHVIPKSLQPGLPWIHRRQPSRATKGDHQRYWHQTVIHNPAYDARWHVCQKFSKYIIHYITSLNKSYIGHLAEFKCHAWHD
jgi:hypothetical protein